MYVVYSSCYIIKIPTILGVNLGVNGSMRYSLRPPELMPSIAPPTTYRSRRSSGGTAESQRGPARAPDLRERDLIFQILNATTTTSTQH